MIVWPDGSVSGSVNVAELEEIHKAQKGMSKKQLAAIGPVESLAQLLAGPPSDDELDAPVTIWHKDDPPPKATAAKKEK